jgi:hypothetical protein
MNQHWRLWEELLLVVEESFAAFSGVSTDLVGHSQAVPKAGCPAGDRLSSAIRASSACRRFRLSAAEKNRSDKGR